MKITVHAPSFVELVSSPVCVKVMQLFNLAHCHKAHVSCKRLIEPEIIPPLHGHQVAKPHVRHLVQHRNGESESLSFGGLLLEQVPIFAESYADYILHGHINVFWDKHLVIL